MNYAEELRAAMKAHGIDYRGPILQDGDLHRVTCEGDSDPNSWYLLYPANPIAAGSFGCWKRDVSENWRQNGKTEVSPDQLKNLRAKWAQDEKIKKEAEVEYKSRMAERAAAEVGRCEKVVAHDYLSNKGVGAHGPMRLNSQGDLLLPLRDISGKIWSYQTIDCLGDKLFMPGGKVQGCFYYLNERKSGPLMICEGYATGASIYEATGFATVCALNCGNLLAVCESIRKLQPNRTILICADNDYKTEGNPGLTKANAAAKAIKAKVAYPQFPPGMTCPQSDFNDLHKEGKIFEVKTQIMLALGFPIARPIGELQKPPKEDPDELLKYRYLCRGGGLLVVGPTGIGKSSFVLQMLALLANGLPAFGIEPTRPLRALYVQAENDDGDISEMRDGIAKGLQFDDAKRQRFFERVIVHTETGMTGRAFFDNVVMPLIVSNEGLDLIVIDPALSYLGAEVKDQKAVGEFLRLMLAPLLAKHRLGAIVVHHTNKPPGGNQKSEWTTSEMAYLGSGSIEWANWSRAVLALQSTSTAGVFKLNAAKRGARLSWKNPEGEKTYSMLIKHFKSDSIICWLPAEESELESPSGAGGRPKKAELEDFLSLIEHESLTTGEWMKSAKEVLNISRATFYRLLEAAELEGKTIKSKINGKWAFVTPRNE